MQTRMITVAAGCLAWVVGCAPKTDRPDVSTVDAFVGMVMADGKPVQFAPTDSVQLEIFTSKGGQYGIPLKPDGTFTIGWMPINKYTGTLNRSKADADGGKGGGMPSRHCIPDFEI